MHRRTLALVTAVALLSAPRAEAQNITFDPFPSIPAGVSVGYITNNFGFFASLPATLAQVLTSASSAIPGGGSALKLNDSGQGFGNFGALFSFSQAISFFSAVGNDFGGSNPGDNERVYLTAFDAAGNVVGTSVFQAAYAQPNLNPASISAASISHVAFTFDTDLGYYAVDDVSWRAAVNVVPEPSTYALMAVGLVGIFAARRRRAA